MIAHRHHRLRGRSLVLAGLAAGIAAGAGNAQAGGTAPAAAHADTLQPDTTIVIRVDADGRVWADFDVARGERRARMSTTGPEPGVGRLGLYTWFPNHPHWPSHVPPGRRAPGTPGVPGVKAPEPPVVRSVGRGSPAEAAGLRAGDVIVAVDGIDSREPNLYSQPRPGRVITFRVDRGGSERDVRVTVAPPPSRPEAERELRLKAACLRRVFSGTWSTEAEWLEQHVACDRAYWWY